MWYKQSQVKHKCRGTGGNGSAAGEPKEVGFSQHPIQVQGIAAGYFWGQNCAWSQGLFAFVESRSVTDLNFSVWEVSKFCLLGWIQQGPALCTHFLILCKFLFSSVGLEQLSWLRAMSVFVWAESTVVVRDSLEGRSWFVGRCLITISWCSLSFVLWAGEILTKIAQALPGNLGGNQAKSLALMCFISLRTPGKKRSWFSNLLPILGMEHKPWDAEDPDESWACAQNKAPELSNYLLTSLQLP